MQYLITITDGASYWTEAIKNISLFEAQRLNQKMSRNIVYSIEITLEEYQKWIDNGPNDK
jgi:hypothetical protein